MRTPAYGNAPSPYVTDLSERRVFVALEDEAGGAALDVREGRQRRILALRDQALGVLVQPDVLRHERGQLLPGLVADVLACRGRLLAFVGMAHLHGRAEQGAQSGERGGQEEDSHEVKSAEEKAQHKSTVKEGSEVKFRWSRHC